VQLYMYSVTMCDVFFANQSRSVFSRPYCILQFIIKIQLGKGDNTISSE